MSGSPQLPLGALWIPPKNKSGYLLICLPGKGGGKEDFDGIQEEIWHPSLGYLFLDGPDKEYGGSSWYGGPQDLQRARDFLTRTIDAVDKLGYPPHRCILLGFSQGGAMVFEFGARYPKLFAGYVCISGRVEDLPSLLHDARPGLLKQARWLVTHGTHDQSLSPETTRLQVAELKAAGFRIEYQEFDKGHTWDFKSELPFIRRWIRSRCALPA